MQQRHEPHTVRAQRRARAEGGGPVAAENARLRAELDAAQRRIAELEALVERDVLVPALNRRGFMRALSRAIDFAGRYAVPVSVVYVDVDAFKAVNDAHGHAAGDAVLVAIVERLAAATRSSDIVGRIGGDEFALILWHADGAAAEAKARALAETIAARPVVVGRLDIAVSVTVGAAEIGSRDTAEAALARADAAMYSGRREAGLTR